MTNEFRFRVRVPDHPGKFVRVCIYDTHRQMIVAAKARHGAIAEGNHVAVTLYDCVGSPGGAVCDIFFSWRVASRHHIVVHEVFHATLVIARKLGIGIGDDSDEQLALISEGLYRGIMRRIEGAGL